MWLKPMGDSKLTKTKMLIREDNPANLGNAWFSLVAVEMTSFLKPIKV